MVIKNNLTKCPVCKYTSDTVEIIKEDYDNKWNVSCPRCGKFITFNNVIFDDQEIIDDLWKLSYWLRVNHENGKIITINDKNDIKKILEKPMPIYREQENNLIRWIGNRVYENPTEMTEYDANLLTSIIGTKNNNGVESITKSLKHQKIIKSKKPTQDISAVVKNNGLSFHMTNYILLGLAKSGWDKYEEIKQERNYFGRAFMAMQYGDDELDNVYSIHIKKAVQQTGFDLFRLDEFPQAGLLDIHLREQIKKSRFLIADLTNNNLGAYWEAGYAEGLGKHVIYLCEKEFFNDFKTHFDTNHHKTIIYDINNLTKAKEDLQATIRSTFPTESIKTDE